MNIGLGLYFYGLSKMLMKIIVLQLKWIFFPFNFQSLLCCTLLDLETEYIFDLFLSII